MTSVPANPQLLSWARHESGFALEQVAKRLNVKPERVEAWERLDTEIKPTMRQIENLAKFFHRPLSVFFMAKPPELKPLAADYRRLPGIVTGHESPQLRLALRQMLLRRENALNLFGEIGEAIPEFKLRAALSESPQAVGLRLREASGISFDEQRGWPSEWRAWARWREALEGLGVLVFQFSKVPLSEVRGVALLNLPLPVAGINSKEIPEAKCFTALHEVVHLMLAAGQQEAPALVENRSEKEWDDVERFAEIAASHALVSEQGLKVVIASLGGVPAQWGLEEVKRVARRFRITPLAMATRLRESGYLSWARYQAWRAEWDAYVATLPARKGGFATPVSKALSYNGRPFTQLVLEALGTNRVTPLTASRYLGLKFEHFGKLREALGEGSQEPAFDE